MARFIHHQRRSPRFHTTLISNSGLQLRIQVQPDGHGFPHWHGIMFVIVCILTIIAFTSQKKWVYYSDER